MYTAKDYDQALLTPERVFDEPMDIVATEALTAEQKLKVLKRWEADAHDMSAAQAENMTGGESSRLDEVRAAIHALTDAEDITEKDAN